LSAASSSVAELVKIYLLAAVAAFSIETLLPAGKV
jgi:hypothetical protein